MQGIILLGLIIGAITSLFFFATSDIRAYIDAISILYTVCFTYLFTSLAFGVSGAIRSVTCIKYLFTQEFAGGERAKTLMKIYQYQIKFCYSGAFILFLIGLIALIKHVANYPDSESLLHLLKVSVPTLAIPFLYAAIFSEGVLRPLKAKLDSYDLKF